MSEGKFKLRCYSCNKLLATIGIVVIPFSGLCEGCLKLLIGQLTKELVGSKN